MTVLKREAENNDEEQLANRRKGKDGSVCMTIVPVFNATHNQLDPLPVKLDAKLSHISMDFGTPGNDNLLSRIDALVDTGAGCTTYW